MICHADCRIVTDIVERRKAFMLRGHDFLLGLLELEAQRLTETSLPIRQYDSMYHVISHPALTLSSTVSEA